VGGPSVALKRLGLRVAAIGPATAAFDVAQPSAAEVVPVAVAAAVLVLP
jgi:hypothetical protein